jgi:hypothetical protein
MFKFNLLINIIMKNNKGYKFLGNIFFQSLSYKYRHFSYIPKEKSCIVLISNNHGLGHVIQSKKILEFLYSHKIKVNGIVFSNYKNLPSYLKIFYQNLQTDIIDLDLFSNSKISANTMQDNISNVFKKVLTINYRKISQILNPFLTKHKPSICLNFFELYSYSYLRSLKINIKFINFASHLGQIYNSSSILNSLQPIFNGCINIPFSLTEDKKCIPNIVDLPKKRPSGNFLLVYGTYPHFLLPHIKKIKKINVVWYTENTKEIDKKLQNHKNIVIKQYSNNFIKDLEVCKGLISNPSKGTVIQALSVNKPIYLIPPNNVVEQNYNLNYIYPTFIGITNAKHTDINTWVNNLDNVEMKKQSLQIRKWLNRTDQQIKNLVLPHFI